jgi:hypothetical protein
MYALSYVSRVGMLVGARNLWSDEAELCVWDCSSEGALGRLRHREASGFSFLAVQSGGIRAALDNRYPLIEVREVISGRLIEKLRLPWASHAVNIVVAADSTVLVAARRSSPPNESFLACWLPVPPARAMWLSRTSERQPQITKRVNGDLRFLALSPDGHTAVGVLGPGLVFHDVTSLEERGRIVSPVHVSGPVAFSPDGRSLLALANRGLAVWPWLELLGKSGTNAKARIIGEEYAPC